MDFVLAVMLMAFAFGNSYYKMKYGRLQSLVRNLARTDLKFSDSERIRMLTDVHGQCVKSAKQSLFHRKEWSELTVKAEETLSMFGGIC